MWGVEWISLTGAGDGGARMPQHHRTHKGKKVVTDFWGFLIVIAVLYLILMIPFIRLARKPWK